jgi:hypothetical protein
MTSSLQLIRLIAFSWKVRFTIIPIYLAISVLLMLFWCLFLFVHVSYPCMYWRTLWTLDTEEKWQGCKNKTNKINTKLKQKKHYIGIYHLLISDFKGPSWPWCYGSWIYYYQFNQWLSPLTLWVRILIRGRCTTFVSDLRKVGGFLQVLRFPPPIKLTTTIQLKYC